MTSGSTQQKHLTHSTSSWKLPETFINCLRAHFSPHSVWQDWSAGFKKVGGILPLAFEKLRGFKASQFGAFCAECMCASASLLPQRSLRCESQRLEVSGPGGARCLRRPAEGGGRRVDDHFLLQPVISSRNHRIYFTQKWKIFCKMPLTYGLIFSFVSMSFITFFFLPATRRHRDHLKCR